MNSCLVNPVLAFVIAYRLIGDSASLSSTLSAKFITADIDVALKKLWSFVMMTYLDLDLPTIHDVRPIRCIFLILSSEI